MFCWSSPAGLTQEIANEVLFGLHTSTPSHTAIVNVSCGAHGDTKCSGGVEQVYGGATVNHRTAVQLVVALLFIPAGWSILTNDIFEGDPKGILSYFLFLEIQ